MWQRKPFFSLWGRYIQFNTHSCLQNCLKVWKNLFPIIHVCLTDLVSDRFLYLFFNDFKSHGHIHRLLKMTRLELSVWRETVLSEGNIGKSHGQDSSRHFRGDRKYPGTSVAWQIGSIIYAASAHWRVTDPWSVFAQL